MDSATDVIRKVSPHSVSDTMDKFEAIIRSKEFDVFARIDHQKNAAGVDLEMAASEVIVFGNPTGGTLLMNSDIRMSLELPLRVAVYQDADEVYIAYRSPSAMAQGYGQQEHKVIAMLTDGLDKLTSAVIA